MVQPEVLDLALAGMCGVSNTGKAFCTITENQAEFEQRFELATVTNYLLQKHQINTFY